MARIQRQDQEDGWHHVMNRGIRRYPIFLHDGDRRDFLDRIRRSASRHLGSVVAYCLMGNHFHLVVRCPPDALSPFVRDFAATYAREFNRRNGYDGALFRERFVSKRIRDDSQLLVTTRYVHRNPLELNQRIADHPWSSYSHYLGTTNIAWVDAELPMSLVGGRERYRCFVETPIPADKFSVSDGRYSVQPEPSAVIHVGTIRDVIAFVADGLSVSSRDLRQAALFLAGEVGVGSADVASQFGFASAGAARMATSRARVKVATEPSLRDLVDRAFAVMDDVAPPGEAQHGGRRRATG